MSCSPAARRAAQTLARTLARACRFTREAIRRTARGGSQGAREGLTPPVLVHKHAHSACARAPHVCPSDSRDPSPDPPPLHARPTPCAPAAGRNFVRGALLGLLATFGGVLLASTPEILIQVAKVKLPEFLSNPGTIVSSVELAFTAPPASCRSKGGACVRACMRPRTVCRGGRGLCVAPSPQVSLKVAGAALANWIITAFYY